MNTMYGLYISSISSFPLHPSSLHIILLVSLGSVMASFKAFLSFLFMFLVVCSALDMSIIDSDRNYDQLDSAYTSGEADVRALFEMWLVERGRLYNAIGEKEKRFEIFKDNLKFIIQQNAKGHPYKLGLNNFADLTHEEYINMYGRGLIMDPEAFSKNICSNRYAFQVGDDLPDSVDWREKGAVTQVINQGECGSCWAWSTVGAVEGINQIVTGNLTRLSAQELLDCVQKSLGCVGGWPIRAMEFIIANGGIDTAQDYPYQYAKGNCDNRKRMNSKVVTINGYERVPRNDEKSLQKAVAQQPVIVAVDTHDRAWQLYGGGIFTAACGNRLNHAVLIVGYGTENGLDYWLVKNTWGTNWGENGFMKIRRNLRNDRLGKCGIAIYPSYPTKSASNILARVEVSSY